MDSSHTKEPALQCKSLCFFLKSFRSLFAKVREREAVFFLLCARGKKKHTHKKNHNRTGNYIQTISISIKAGTSPKGKNQNTCFMSKVIERLTATTWSPKQPCMSEDGKNAVSLTNTQDEWWSLKASIDEEFIMCRVLDQGTRKDYEMCLSGTSGKNWTTKPDPETQLLKPGKKAGWGHQVGSPTWTFPMGDKPFDLASKNHLCQTGSNNKNKDVSSVSLSRSKSMLHKI